MNNFDLIQKTHIVFGKGEEKRVGNLVKGYSDSCLIVHDGGVYLENLLTTIRDSLTASGIRFVELSGVRMNPLVSKANEGVELCVKENIGFILAVGGGSVMDTAKYIAYAVNCPGNPLAVKLGTKVSHQVLPHGTVVTLSGTSSECSNCCMIINDLKEPVVKHTLANIVFYFDFSIINPELMYTLPLNQLASGTMDAISHALDVYLGSTEEEPIMEGYIETAIKTLLHYGPIAMEDPQNYRVRSLLSIAVMMAYNDNFSIGGIVQNWGIHRIETPVTATFNCTHGTIIGILAPSFIRFVSPKNPRPFVNFSVRCMGVDPVDKSQGEIVEEGAFRLEAWLRTMKLPTSLREISLSADMLELCAKQSEPGGAVYPIDRDEIMQIYKMAE